MHGLIDADLLVYRIGYSTEDTTERLAGVRLKHYFESILERLLLSSHTAYITSNDKSNYRFTIDSSYKGNRTQPKPTHYEYLRSELVDNPLYNCTVVSGCEADDQIGIDQSTRQRGSSIIISIDKDLDQIPGWHYNFIKEKKYYVSKINGLRFFYKQLLMGDSSDNVDGITGIGKAMASDLIDGLDTESDMLGVVHHIYTTVGIPEEELVKRGVLLKIRTQENESLWQLPESFSRLPESEVQRLIVVNWKKSFERYSKRQNSKNLSTNQSDSTSSIQVNSDSTNQIG